MSDHGYEEDDYDSESDRALLADIHALLEPASVSPPRSQPDNDAAVHKPSSPTAKLDSSDSDDDFELLRQIQRRYRVGGSDRQVSPKSVATIQSANSEPDDDDDFEVLRAIKRRFRQYSALGVNGDGSKEAGDVRGKSILDSHAVEGENRNSLSGKTVKCVLAFIDAIKKNRSAQKFIRNQMLSVEARMGDLKMIIRRVRVIREFDVQGRKKIELRKDGDREQFIAVRSNDESAKGAMKYGPQENSRVVNYKMAFQKYPQWIPRARWTTVDRIKLKNGVVQRFQKSLLLKSMDQVNESEGSEASASVDGIMSMVGGVKVTPQTLKAFLPNIDWNELASNYLPRRSGLECQARWINHEDPLINHEQWVLMEDKGILMYVRQNGFNWVAIADSLATNRTPFDCLARYQRSLNPHLIKREWTPTEDAELTAAVQKYGESNWTVVSATMEGRTAPQCSNRWLKSLLPSKQKKGKWEPHEDMRLKIAVRLMGKCWNKIAEFVPGRTQASCRDRWVNCLDPSLNRGRWTEEEDRKLEEGIKVHGYSWTKVASCIPPRTDSQCRRRWMALFPDEVGQLQTAKKLRNALLPSNFVDREPYRPTLEANDFKDLALEGGMAEVANVDSSKKGSKKLSRSKKSSKVSDTAFCMVPKKPRSKGTRRRRVRFFEIPMIHDRRSLRMVDGNNALPRKSGRVKGDRVKQSKHGEVDLSLADLKKTLNKRKRELKIGSLANRSNSSVLDDNSVCSAGRLEEEHQQDRPLTDLGSMELDDSSGGNIGLHSRDETKACGSKTAGKRPKKKRRNSVEPRDSEELTLADVFGRAALRKSRGKGDAKV